MKDLKGVCAYLKLMAITMACHTLCLEPLALGAASTAALSPKIETAQAFSDIAKKNKTSSMYTYLLAMAPSLSPEARSSLTAYFSQNKDIKFPDLRFEKGSGKKGEDLVKIFYHLGKSQAIIEVVGEEDVFVKVNGVKFSYDDVADFKPMLTRLQAMYKNDNNGNGLNKKREPSSIKKTTGKFYVPWKKLIKAPRYLQRSYLRSSRDLAMALQDFHNRRTPGYKAPKKSVWQQRDFLQNLITPKAHAVSCTHQYPPDGHDSEGNSPELCVIAGQISTYGQEGGSTWSCGKKEQDTEGNDIRAGCEGNAVSCSPILFGKDESGGPFCASCPSTEECLGATYECDKKSPLEDEKDFSRINSSLGQDDQDSEQRISYYEKLEEDHAKSIAVCDGASADGPNEYVKQCQDQAEACEVLRKRAADLARIKGAIAGPPPVPPIIVPPRQDCGTGDDYTSNMGKAKCVANEKCIWDTVRDGPTCVTATDECNPEQIETCVAQGKSCVMKEEPPGCGLFVATCVCDTQETCIPPKKETASWIPWAIGGIIAGLLALCFFAICKSKGKDKKKKKKSGGGGKPHKPKDRGKPAEVGPNNPGERPPADQ